MYCRFQNALCKLPIPLTMEDVSGSDGNAQVLAKPNSSSCMLPSPIVPMVVGRESIQYMVHCCTCSTYHFAPF